jgi:hypothetical protein
MGPARDAATGDSVELRAFATLELRTGLSRAQRGSAGRHEQAHIERFVGMFVARGYNGRTGQKLGMP